MVQTSVIENVGKALQAFGCLAVGKRKIHLPDIYPAYDGCEADGHNANQPSTG